MGKSEMSTTDGAPDRPPKGKPYLTAATGRHAGRLYPIEPGAPLLLGRNPECHLRFPDAHRVSKIHAEVGVDPDGEAWLRDMSRNGTSVGGRLVHRERSALKHGDWIVLGASADALRVEWLPDDEVQIRILPFVDLLTGVGTRLHLQSRLADVLASDEDMAQPLSVLMLDVDRFGDFNKTYGQTTGDAVLREIAECLRSTVHEMHPGGDAGRHGGEEFLVLLPRCGLQSAVAIAETFRRRVEELKLEDGGNSLRVTGSLGAAECRPRHDTSLDDLVRLVNPHLIRAKDGGRNRTCWPGDGDPRAANTGRTTAKPTDA